MAASCSHVDFPGGMAAATVQERDSNGRLPGVQMVNPSPCCWRSRASSRSGRRGRPAFPATGSSGTVEGVRPRLVVGLLAVGGRSYVLQSCHLTPLISVN